MAVSRALIALAFACWLSPAAAVETDTIYRCIDVRGQVALRDTPCPKGQQQQRRELIRPTDAPRPAVASQPIAAKPAQAPEPQPRVLVINAPRPLYECVTPDGDSYTSDTSEGNPRWVPLWTLDYPVLAERTTITPGSGSLRYSDGRVGGRYRSGGISRDVVPTIAGYGAGTWIRDACSALPQQEVCARIIDRRDELRRRFFNAQPSERERLNREERGINARLSSDCGGY